MYGRVRVAVRLRPRNAEELAADADFADCVELQPEVVIFCHFHFREKLFFGNNLSMMQFYLFFLPAQEVET